MGGGSAKYFPGIAVGISYETHYKNYFAKVSINYLEELLILGGEAQNVKDYSLTINRAISIKPFDFSIGTGLSYVKNKLDIENFYTPEPGYFIPNEYRFIKKGSFGYPADLQIMTQRKKGLIAGIGAHANFNSFNTFYNVYIQIGYTF